MALEWVGKAWLENQTGQGGGNTAPGKESGRPKKAAGRS